MQARIPLSTYRLQFNQHFTFEQAAALVDYLAELGVGDCYSSPILKARPGSLHGYDIVDHTLINPEVGTEEQFVAFARALRERGMSILMDVVPNHMCIAGSENRWWLDLLENGPGSPFARFFDVDWSPPNPSLKDRVLLPILGDQFGRVLDNQEIKISYRGGAFFANYYENVLPIAPRTSTIILALALEDARGRLGESHPDVHELESLITALRHLPPRTDTDPAQVRERRREKEVVKRRLSTLVKASGEVRGAVHDALIKINGAKGSEQSFDYLEELLSQQAYRLSFWRVAADEINYRRFFDINELAAVRIEERTVFNAVHEVVFRLMKQGLVTGLRVDHVDGLHDPEKYLRDLSRECGAALGNSRRADSEGDDGADSADESGVPQRPPCYVAVEKILGHDELLRREWPVSGTTGYEFANLLNGVFVDHSNAPALRELYRDFTGLDVKFDDLLYGCKKLVLRVAMSSELHVLARRLGRIAEQHRWSRDFTLNSLQQALGEVIACFPVYRTYIRPRQIGVSPDDRLHIGTAIRAAKRRNPATDPSVFDFIGSLLLLHDPKGINREQRAERRDFILRFQQLTSPVTAKGLEDTAFYRFYPLASLNEVGGEPAIIGIPVERFHERNRDRQENWPHSLSATSTHDSKRSEDVRARINVLSEIPEEWNRALHRWREMNRPRKASLEGSEVPAANEEYLLYQTLVGTWPLQPLDEGARRVYVGRVQEYMNKALKEAKLQTSWISPNEPYERAVREFVGAILEPGEDNPFVKDFEEFQQTTTRAGLLGSLSQTLLKIASPGVPDFYQGTELWSFALVDPDNRRPVDYELRKSLLDSLKDEGVNGDAGLVERLMLRPEDGRIKLFVTTRALNFRKAHRELFEQGDYLPLRATGGRENHVIAFARRRGGEEVLAVVSRFFTRHGIGRSVNGWVGPDTWRDTSLLLPEGSGGGRYRDVFTGAEFSVEEQQAAASLPIARVLERMPVALLERVGGVQKKTEVSG